MAQSIDNNNKDLDPYDRISHVLVLPAESTIVQHYTEDSTSAQNRYVQFLARHLGNGSFATASDLTANLSSLTDYYGSKNKGFIQENSNFINRVKSSIDQILEYRFFIPPEENQDYEKEKHLYIALPNKYEIYKKCENLVPDKHLTKEGSIQNEFLFYVSKYLGHSQFLTVSEFHAALGSMETKFFQVASKPLKFYPKTRKDLRGAPHKQKDMPPQEKLDGKNFTIFLIQLSKRLESMLLVIRPTVLDTDLDRILPLSDQDQGRILAPSLPQEQIDSEEESPEAKQSEEVPEEKKEEGMEVPAIQRSVPIVASLNQRSDGQWQSFRLVEVQGHDGQWQSFHLVEAQGNDGQWQSFQLMEEDTSSSFKKLQGLKLLSSQTQEFNTARMWPPYQKLEELITMKFKSKKYRPWRGESDIIRSKLHNISCRLLNDVFFKLFLNQIQKEVSRETYVLLKNILCDLHYNLPSVSYYANIAIPDNGREITRYLASQIKKSENIPYRAFTELSRALCGRKFNVETLKTYLSNLTWKDNRMQYKKYFLRAVLYYLVKEYRTDNE